MNQAARAENDDADESEAVNEAKGLYRAGNSIKKMYQRGENQLFV